MATPEPAVQMTSEANDFAYISDPNERRRLALAEIDQAPFGWYHVRACIVAGVGFFTDAYDLFVVSLLTIMLGIVFWPQAKGKMPTTADTAIKVSTSAGTVIGQVGFGALADFLGRKRMYGIELIVMIVATLGQALSSPSPGVSVVGLVIFWRVVMGVGKSYKSSWKLHTKKYSGIGGDYPLSAIITSEYVSSLI